MKIKYEFVNGDVIEIEAPDEIGEVIVNHVSKRPFARSFKATVTDK